jgi:hypothetical protein
LNEWRLRGHLDYFALSLLIGSLIPFGTLLKKAKIAGKRLIGASDDLTRIFRKAGGRSRKVVQTIGELGAELTARAKGFKPTGFRPPYHSFDGIYKKGSRFIIVEAKGGTSKLAKGQMSKDWIRRHIDSLLHSGDPVNEALAKKLSKAWKNQMVDGMVVSTKIIGDKVDDPQFVFKSFHQIGETAF